MDAFEILVLVLSIVLGIFLIAATVCMIVFIKVVKDIRHITQKASLAADNIGQAAEFFKNTSGVSAMVKLVGNAVETFRKGKK